MWHTWEIWAGAMIGAPPAPATLRSRGESEQRRISQGVLDCHLLCVLLCCLSCASVVRVVCKWITHNCDCKTNVIGPVSTLGNGWNPYFLVNLPRPRVTSSRRVVLQCGIISCSKSCLTSPLPSRSVEVVCGKGVAKQGCGAKSVRVVNSEVTRSWRTIVATLRVRFRRARRKPDRLDNCHASRNKAAHSHRSTYTVHQIFHIISQGQFTKNEKIFFTLDCTIWILEVDLMMGIHFVMGYYNIQHRRVFLKASEGRLRSIHIPVEVKRRKQRLTHVKGYKLMKSSTSTILSYMYQTKGDVCMCTRNQLKDIKLQ